MNGCFSNSVINCKNLFQVLGLLNEAQDQIRKLRKRQLPTARVGINFGMKTGPQMSAQLSQSPLPSINSTLGAELETSLLSDSSLDSGVSVEKPQLYSRIKIFLDRWNLKKHLLQSKLQKSFWDCPFCFPSRLQCRQHQKPKPCQSHAWLSYEVICCKISSLLFYYA